MGERLARILFFGSVVAALAAAAFAVGVLAGKGRLALAAPMEETYYNLRSLARWGEFVPRNRRVPAPPGAAAERHRLNAPDRAIAEGYFALLGWDDANGHYAVWLHDARGRLVHRYPIDEMTFSDRAESRSNAPHAFQILADGSILVSFDWLGLMARLDPCGRSLWTRDGFYHHAFSPTEDGRIWTWLGRDGAYGTDQVAVLLDPQTGRTTASLALRDVIAADRHAAALLSVDGEPLDRGRDLFHPNDVEELPRAMAAAFPMFRAGDLLISIRNLDLVAVISRAGQIRWASYGPWRQQHDPDFNADGTITVFDNNPGRDHARLWRIRPGSGAGAAAARVLPAAPGLRSQFRGKQQVLPNGNLLVTIPEQGRAVELAPDGTAVREFNNLSAVGPGWHEDLVNAKWLPADALAAMPACAGTPLELAER